MKTVICIKCNWTSFAVTLKFAQDEILQFNTYFDSLTPKEQTDYYRGKKSSIDNYTCQRCNGTEFKIGNTAPFGSTINPVIYESSED